SSASAEAPVFRIALPTRAPAATASPQESRLATGWTHAIEDKNNDRQHGEANGLSAAPAMRSGTLTLRAAIPLTISHSRALISAPATMNIATTTIHVCGSDSSRGGRAFGVAAPAMPAPQI